VAKSLIEVGVRLVPGLDRRRNSIAVLLCRSLVSILRKDNGVVDLPQLEMWEYGCRGAGVGCQRNSEFVDFTQNNGVQIPSKLRLIAVINAEQTEIGRRIFWATEACTSAAERTLSCEYEATQSSTPVCQKGI
jgi:hypothetical protein